MFWYNQSGIPRKIRLALLALCLLSPATAMAQNKVVVIPLGGRPKPPAPFAPLAAESPSNSDYTVGLALPGLTSPHLIDKKTGLQWQRLDDNNTRNWASAVAYCAGLDWDDKTDWRLPDVLELQSIVDYGASNPAINQWAFPDTNPSFYWSASSRASSTLDAWNVDFSGGVVGTAAKTTLTHYVRCVR